MKEFPKETIWQKKIHQFISDPSKVFKTTKGNRLQFLSPGKLNRNPGPDFLDVAILINSNVVICDCEFHIKASDWINHKHSSDPMYANVGLHIIFENDTELYEKFETLVIDPESLPEPREEEPLTENEFIDTIDELQNYALLRLLRKTADARILANSMPLKDALNISIKNYLYKYLAKRHRPVYKNFDFDEFANALTNSELFKFLIDIQNNEQFNITERFYTMMKTRIHNEGNHLRREILLNCVLPLALAIANEEQRIGLFVWFWSTPALNSYGILTTKFKNIPQNFIWQQQGMLEILYNFGKKSKISPQNFLKIGEVLNFFQVGNPPFPSSYNLSD